MYSFIQPGKYDIGSLHIICLLTYKNLNFI